MLKFFCRIFILFFVLSCQQPDKEITFKGVWIEKSVLENKDKAETVDSLAKFPLILFEQEGGDSVLFYYDHSKRNVYPAEYAYNSYFVHFDKHNEYFLTPDYTTGELVFSNLKDDEFYRFVKIKPGLTRAEVLNPAFDIDSFIQLVE
ncbi:hypothetical protein [Leadbetterella sp. DM7]|uniref:hypothetical protein n=1 Tax=Leadbetterella sp. DM7 TaxID=3235085 RepID=UPI00349E99C8